MVESSKSPLFFVVGTTATGKSGLAIDVAEQFSGCIFNADSVQLYQRVDIGTAKPSPRDQARAPHHFFDVVEPGGQMTAGEYQELARKQVLELLKSQVVLLVGGSGFYIQAFEKGMMPSPKSPPKILSELTKQLDEQGAQALHDELAAKDPEYATRVNATDSYRVIRALSIIRAEGRSMTEIAKQFEQERKQNVFPVEPIKIGLKLDRELLRERVRRRLEDMVASGLKAEVQSLIEQGHRDWSPMTSVGYKETVQLLEGEISESEWLPLMETSTMQLAKRQRTWFQRDKSITWFDAESERQKAFDFAASQIEKRRAK